MAAVGITLTSASRVYLFEPCVDPGMEAQAAGRVHRLGQTKEVFIRRFAFKNSIEEAVVELQGEISAGRLSEFRWDRIDGIMFRVPIITASVKNLFKRHSLQKPHTHAADVEPRTTGYPTFAREYACSKCGCWTKAERCIFAAQAAASSSNS